MCLYSVEVTSHAVNLQCISHITYHISHITYHTIAPKLKHIVACVSHCAVLPQGTPSRWKGYAKLVLSQHKEVRAHGSKTMPDLDSPSLGERNLKEKLQHQHSVNVKQLKEVSTTFTCDQSIAATYTFSPQHAFESIHVRLLTEQIVNRTTHIVLCIYTRA